MKGKINTTLNGEARSLEVDIATSTLDLLRDELGLTGTKLVCGSGVCGACTVLLNGEARCSCLLPATQLEGKQLQTIEGVSQGNLHPVQKAFLAHDGLQCGFCTPGFIMEGIALYEQWKKSGKQGYPSRDEVASAFAGHLCRCGAYVGIYEAIQAACAGKYDGPEIPTYHRVDGIPKVTGAAKYTADIQLPGQLVGMILRSSVPHARTRKLDFAAAEAMPGVKAVIRMFPGDESKYEGQALAAVAAESREIAEAALKAIVYEFEALPFVLDPDEARKVGAPEVHADSKKDLPVASEGPIMPGSWEGNVRKASISIASSDRGKAKKATSDAHSAQAHFFQAQFRTPTQFHTAFETHCAVAQWLPGGKLEVYVSTQSVYWLAKDIAEHYDMPEENVHVIADFVGGAFGSKIALRTESFAAIELAKKAQLPVSVVYSRAEELIEAGYRPSTTIDIKLSSDADGNHPGYSMVGYNNSGVAIGASVADIAGLIYTGIAKDLHDYDVVTHFSPGSAFRGPGGPAAIFALEQSIDQLAHQLNMDPVAFRRKWETDPGYVALFDWVEKLPLWKNRANLRSDDPRFSKGVGLAFGGWMHLYMPSAEVSVSIGANGITVSNALQDMGQGAKSVMAQAVGEVFGMANTAIHVQAGDSRLLIGPASAGSRTATTIFPAAKEAAEKLKARILERLAQDAQFANVQFTAEGIVYSGGLLTWPDAFARLGAMSEKVTRGRNDGFTAMGMMPLAQGLTVGKGRSVGAYVIAVEVDTWLGKVRVTEVHGAMRVGKIHLKPLALSQCYGGVIQGIGHVLYEDRALCKATGRALTRGLEDYRIPGIGDIPEIHIDFLEEGFEFVKEKGIGLAELCTIPVAGAVANAVFAATNWRPTVSPLIPERVLAGLAQKS